MFEGRGALKINNNAGRHHVMCSLINPYFEKHGYSKENMKKNQMQELSQT